MVPRHFMFKCTCRYETRAYFILEERKRERRRVRGAPGASIVSKEKNT